MKALDDFFESLQKWHALHPSLQVLEKDVSSLSDLTGTTLEPSEKEVVRQLAKNILERGTTIRQLFYEGNKASGISPFFTDDALSIQVLKKGSAAFELPAGTSDSKAEDDGDSLLASLESVEVLTIKPTEGDVTRVEEVFPIKLRHFESAELATPFSQIDISLRATSARSSTVSLATLPGALETIVKKILAKEAITIAEYVSIIENKHAKQLIDSNGKEMLRSLTFHVPLDKEFDTIILEAKTRGTEFRSKPAPDYYVNLKNQACRAAIYSSFYSVLKPEYKIFSNSLSQSFQNFNQPYAEIKDTVLGKLEAETKTAFDVDLKEALDMVFEEVESMLLTIDLDEEELKAMVSCSYEILDTFLIDDDCLKTEVKESLAKTLISLKEEIQRANTGGYELDYCLDACENGKLRGALIKQIETVSLGNFDVGVGEGRDTFSLKLIQKTKIKSDGSLGDKVESATLGGISVVGRQRREAKVGSVYHYEPAVAYSSDILEEKRKTAI